MTWMVGMGMGMLMAVVSRRTAAYTRGSSCSVTGFALVVASATLSEKK